MEEQDEYEILFPLMDYLYHGNLARHPKSKISFKEWNNDVINKEKEKELTNHYIWWFKRENDIPDSDEEEEAANALL